MLTPELSRVPSVRVKRDGPRLGAGGGETAADPVSARSRSMRACTSRFRRATSRRRLSYSASGSGGGTSCARRSSAARPALLSVAPAFGNCDLTAGVPARWLRPRRSAGRARPVIPRHRAHPEGCPARCETRAPRLPAHPARRGRSGRGVHSALACHDDVVAVAANRHPFAANGIEPSPPTHRRSLYRSSAIATSPTIWSDLALTRSMSSAIVWCAS